MFRLQALNSMHSDALAVLCGEVAASHPECAINGHIREIAISLMREWTQLEAPTFGFSQDTRRLELRRSALRQRMIDFLVSI